MDFVERQKPPPPFKARITSFVEIHQTREEEGQITALNRRDASLDKASETPEAEKILIPISDTVIIKDLEKVVFPHPYTLIGLLEKWEPPQFDEVVAALLPFHLYAEQREGDVPGLISQLAQLFFMEPDTFLASFKGNIPTEKIRKSWRAIMTYGQKDADIERQIRFFETSVLTTLPSVDFALKSIHDLYALHVLACSMNTRMFLMLVPSQAMARGNDANLRNLPPMTYCLPLGCDDAKYSLYIAVVSMDTFYIARPQVKEKTLRPRRERQNGDSLLKTFETMDNHMAVYYVYRAEGDEESQEATKIRAVLAESNAMNAPEMRIMTHGDVLELNFNLPSFNKDNDCLLNAICDGVCDEKEERVADDSQSQLMLMCDDVFAVGGEAPQKFLITRRCTKGSVPLKDMRHVRTETDLHAAMKAAWNLFYSSTEDSLLGVHALRTSSAHIADAQREMLVIKPPSSCFPLFLPSATVAALSQFSKCPYAEMLCIRSMIRFGIGMKERTCPRCRKVRRSGEIIYPYRECATNELKWICTPCLKLLQKKQNTDGRSKSIIHNILPMFIAVPEKQRVDYLKRLLECYDKNIAALRNNPCGYLTEMLPFIDRSFEGFQAIRYTYYHFVESVARSQEEERKNLMCLKAMMGIRTMKDVQVHFGDVEDLDEAKEFPADFLSFSEYLEVQTDVSHSSSEFGLIQHPERILADMYYAAMKPFAKEFNRNRQDMTTAEFFMKLQQGKNLDVILGFSDDVDITLPERYRYEVYPIVSASHLSLSPITSISTDLVIDNIWAFDSSRILVLSHEQPRSDCRYCRTYIHILHHGNICLSKVNPLWEFPEELAITDCVFSGGQLGISYETVSDALVELITISGSTVTTQPPIQVQAPTIAFGPEDCLYFALKQDEGIFVVSWKDPSTSLFDNLSDKDKLIGTKSYLIAVCNDGSIHTITTESGDHIEPLFPESLSPDAVGCPIFPYTLSQNNGLMILPTPAIPFQSGEDRVIVEFHSSSATHEFVGCLGPSLATRHAVSRQLGMVQLPREDPNRSLWNVHLTIAELIPALVAYEHGNKVYCVRNDMTHFYATKCHSFLPAAIGAFYARTVNAISLHHIEDVILAHGLKVNIIGFMALMDNDTVSSFIDTIFGTRFQCVDIPGIWVGMRVVDDTAHVIIYFKDMANHDKLQLMSLYRGANVIELCTTKLIASLNFVYVWQNESRSRNVLTARDRFPKLQVSLFMPLGKTTINEEAVVDYKNTKKIAADVTKVPFRESWNTSTFETPEDDENQDDVSVEFATNWNEILHLEHCGPDSVYREPQSSMVGIGIVKQIIATYITLLEFDDLAPFTVLRHCTLMFPDA